LFDFVFRKELAENAPCSKVIIDALIVWSKPLRVFASLLITFRARWIR